MIRIEAETPTVLPILQEILDLVQTGGGEVHPDACLQERDGQFSVFVAPDRAEQAVPLFRLPAALLIPVAQLRWDERDDALAYQLADANLTPIQQRLLRLHVRLYNAVDKAAWARVHLPSVALADHPALLAAVRSFRPGFCKEGQSSAEKFIQTRIIRYRAAKATGSEAAVRVLMPLIDLLNHHPTGAGFQTDASGMRVALAQPEPGGECFASYGYRRDVLNLALHYGFLDRQSPWVWSAPVDVEVAGIGSVHIENRQIRSKHPLDPPKLDFRDSGVTLSHLVFHRNHPEQVRAVLRLALLGAARRAGLNDRQAGRTVEPGFVAIRDANLRLLDALERETASCAHTLPCAALLARVGQVQREVIAASLTPPAGR